MRILATQSNAESFDVQVRRKIDNVWQEVTIQKPKIIAEKYNFNNGNVDQLMSYNSVIRKSRSFAYKLVMLSILRRRYNGWHACFPNVRSGSNSRAVHLLLSQEFPKK